MRNFIFSAAADVIVILLTFILFTVAIPGYKRHIIWEKYISSFARFVIYIFLISLIINILTAVIVYAVDYEEYFSLIVSVVQSVLIGFIVSCVPRRGVGDKKQGI